MRSAEHRLLALAACLALAGCGALPKLPFGGDAQKPAEAKATEGKAVAPATAASAPVAAQAAPEAPVNPAAQRAFDDARRAMRANRLDEAERGFKALAQAYPELGGPHANLGLIYRQAGKLPQAVAELEQATKLSPRQPLYFNELGVAYRQQGQFAKAREAYEAALALDPNYAAAVLNLGILHDLYLGDGAQALALYERYLALSPGGDAQVNKWIVDLKNRRPKPAAAKKESR